MAITITAFDANGDGTGLSFAAYLASFDATFVRSNRGYFSDNPTDLSGDEYAVSSNAADQSLPIPTGQAFIADSGASGQLVYDFATNTLGGTLDAIEFGDGLAYNAGTDDFTTTRDVTIAGLGLSSTGGTGNVHLVVNDLLNGNVAELNRVITAETVTFAGSAGRDTFTGFGGADTLRGNDGNDVLNGGGGADKIAGGAGNDRLAGGAGNDTLNGNGGADIFIFTAGFGLDRIGDFAAGASLNDRIQFSTSLFSDFQDVLDNTVDVGGNAVITFNAANKLTLLGVSEAALNANDFLFV